MPIWIWFACASRSLRKAQRGARRPRAPLISDVAAIDDRLSGRFLVWRKLHTRDFNHSWRLQAGSRRSSHDDDEEGTFRDHQRGDGPRCLDAPGLISANIASAWDKMLGVGKPHRGLRTVATRGNEAKMRREQSRHDLGRVTRPERRPFAAPSVAARRPGLRMLSSSSPRPCGSHRAR